MQLVNFYFNRLGYNYKLSLLVLTNTKPGIAKKKEQRQNNLPLY